MQHKITDNMNLELLNKQFAISNKVNFKSYKHTIVAEIESPVSTATISLYGAQVLSFKANKQDELLFMSSKSAFENGKAIRGGIPVCWPWFGANTTDPSLPSHGFARNSIWDVVNTRETENEVIIVLGLKSNEDTLKMWPYLFNTTLEIKVGSELTVSLKTTNTDNKPFNISAALHSYFLISDIETVKLEGLESTAYFNNLNQTNEIQKDDILTFSERTDRQYKKTKTTCIIHDTERKIRVGKEGSHTTVVWNPGAELSKEMIDLGDLDYKKMLCVEASNSLENSIDILPQQSHTLTTIIK